MKYAISMVISFMVSLSALIGNVFQLTDLINLTHNWASWIAIRWNIGVTYFASAWKSGLVQMECSVDRSFQKTAKLDLYFRLKKGPL